MATTVVSLNLEEYLNTSYTPDREYIDGELVERNVGKWDHARVQWLLAKILSRQDDEWGFSVLLSSVPASQEPGCAYLM